MTNMRCLLRQMARPPQPIEQRQKRQAEHGEMIALDALEQLDARAFELIAADARGRRVADGIEIASRNPSENARIVRCAASTCSKTTVPAATTATAECSVWVLPRSAASCSRAPARSAALENRRSPSASVWSAPSTMRSGMLAPPPPAPSPAPAAPRPSPASSSPARASTARSSISAGSISTGMPAASSNARRAALFEASTSGCAASHSGMMRALA